MRGREVGLLGKHAIPPRALRDRVLFQEILDSLAELYSLLQEEDMWAGLWQKRCKYSETATAIAYEQHGFFEQVALPGTLRASWAVEGAYRGSVVWGPQGGSCLRNLLTSWKHVPAPHRLLESRLSFGAVNALEAWL